MSPLPGNFRLRTEKSGGQPRSFPPVSRISLLLAILLLGAGLLALSLLLVPGLALGLLMLFVLAGALARCVLFIRVFHGGYSLGEEAGVPAGVASWGKQTPAAVTQP